MDDLQLREVKVRKAGMADRARLAAEMRDWILRSVRSASPQAVPAVTVQLHPAAAAAIWIAQFESSSDKAAQA